ncbi:MAG: hypothetical protein IJN39_05795, partial [Clostridia bacterium]|nr:hypothetical protein [Clostridia bacterium]
IFNKRRDEVIIKVIHKGNKSGIGEVGLDADDYYNMSENNKPYVQKGNPVTVTVEAAYPFQMELGGKEIDLADIKVSIPITTTTLKYYKDLYYYIEN